MLKFFHRHKLTILIIGGVFSFIYLLTHHFIFDDDYTYTSIWKFIIDGKNHVFHIAPVIIVFFVLLGLSIRDKMRK